MGDKIVGHTTDDDHKAFKPHADIDNNGDTEKPRDGGANLLEKEKQGDSRVCSDRQDCQ